MSDRSSIQGFRTRDKKRDGARQAALAVMIFIFVLAPLFITQSIIFAEPIEAVALIGLIALFVMLLVPFHDRAVNMKPFFWGLILFLALHVMWPRYLSLQVPHLRLVSPIRITLIVLLATWAFMAATSSAVHNELWRRLKATPAVSLCVLSIVVVDALSILFSELPRLSGKVFITEGLGFYAIFAAAVSLIRTRRDLEVVTRWIAALGIIVAVLLIAERVTHVNLFATYLGGFVNYQAPWLHFIMNDFRRDGLTGTYRARGPFATPLSAGEYLVLALPFVFYWVERTSSAWWRWSLIATVPLVLAGIWTTNTRTSILASLVVVGLYGVLRGLLFLRAGRKSRLRPVVILVIVGLFAAFAIGIAIVFLRMDPQSAFGAEGTRSVQLQMGIPKVLHRPLTGYGLGMAGYILGYRSAGILTIDNYYLSTALDVGLPGLFCFIAALGAMIFGATRRVFTNSSERGLMMAFAIMGIGFALTRFTTSETENLNAFYIMLGAFVAAVRITSLDADAAAELEAEPSGKELRMRRRTIVGSARWRRQVRLR